MEIPPQLLLLAPLGVAAGLDLYLALLILGVVLRLGFSVSGAEGALPPESLPALAVAATLYLLEMAAELRDTTSLAWHTLQLALRPFGGALLALALLAGQPAGLKALGIGLASVVAAFSHVLFRGQALALRLRRGRGPSPLVYRGIISTAAMALLFLVLFTPRFSVFVGVGLLCLGLLLGGWCHGLVRFGVALLSDRVWGIVSPTDWTPERRLPPWVRRAIPREPLNPSRGARAATSGLVREGGVQAGWILQRKQGLFFVFRRRAGSRSVPVEGCPEAHRSGPAWKTLSYRSPEGRRWALFLQVGLNGPESHK